MKKNRSLILVGLFALALLFIAPLAVLAQETTTETILGVQVDPVAVLAIVAIIGGGIVSLVVQLLKKKLAFISQGIGAFAFSAVLSYGVTAVWFAILHPMKPWLWPTFAVYGLCVLGEATGAFHLIKKITGTPSIPPAPAA